MKNHFNAGKAIVFDFGGVLIDWNPRYLYLKLFKGDAEAMESFFTEIGFAEWNLEQDRGRFFNVAVAELSQRFPQYRDLIIAYDERWEESISGPIQPVVDILYMLKQKGYPLYGLSNWSDEKFQLVRTKYGFFHWFDDILVSGAVKFVKPDPRIFTRFLEKIGCKAAECLFIDDSEANIKAANELGFKTIRYESSEQLRTVLQGLGYL